MTLFGLVRIPVKYLIKVRLYLFEFLCFWYLWYVCSVMILLVWDKLLNLQWVYDYLVIYSYCYFFCKLIFPLYQIIFNWHTDKPSTRISCLWFHLKRDLDIKDKNESNVGKLPATRIWYFRSTLVHSRLLVWFGLIDL